MEYLLVLLFLNYFVLVLSFIIGFDSFEDFKLDKKPTLNCFSLLVPFRNEAENLPRLLNSIQELNYPRTHFEVVLINDFSTDNFQSIIDEFQKNNPEINLKLLKNRHSNSPKKAAIKLGIKNAKFPFITTTDADCILPKDWLKGFDYSIQKNNSSMICAPVSIETNNNLISKFEALNFNSLQGSTIGSFGIQKPFLCNGANLCYNKKVFSEVNGFKGNDNIASGDDIFLLEKFLAHDKTAVHFLKSTEMLVKTKGQNDLKSFFQQQIRWAKKSSAYKNKTSIIVGGLVFLTNLFLLISIVFVILGKLNPAVFTTCFVFKLLIDFILIAKTNQFSNQKKLNYFILPASLLYPFFILTIFIASIRKNYNWKGRKFER